MEKNIKTIKNLLLLLVIVLAAYLLKLLSFLFIPLALALFITLLLMPLLAWFQKKKLPYFVGLAIIIIVGFFVLKGIGEVIQHTGKKIVERQDVIAGQFNAKIAPLIVQAESWLDIDFLNGENGMLYSGVEKVFSSNALTGVTGNLMGTLGNFTSGALMTLIFLIVMLGGVQRYQRYINYVSGGGEENGVSAVFKKVKNSLTTFMKVKFLISLATGVSFGLIAWIFGVDFPLFWGFMAFVLNFIQAIGSVVITVTLVLFGFLQIDSMTMFWLFAVLLAAMQIIFGSILEPIFMGRSFSINTVFVLIGLMVWGYLWGVPGLILAIPLLVLIKTILASSRDGQFIERLMGRSGFKK